MTTSEPRRCGCGYAMPTGDHDADCPEDARRAQAFAMMRDHPQVRLRAIGVIGSWLRNNTGVVDPYAEAKSLISMMTDAGLATFLLSDLQAFVDDISNGYRAQHPLDYPVSHEPVRLAPRPVAGSGAAGRVADADGRSERG